MAGTAKEELLEMPAGLDRSFPSVVLEFSSFALSARKRLNASELGVERTKSSRGCLSDSVEFDHRKSFVRSLHFPVFQPEPSLFYCIVPSEISFFHFLCFLQKGLRGGILRAHHYRPFSRRCPPPSHQWPRPCRRCRVWLVCRPPPLQHPSLMKVRMMMPSSSFPSGGKEQASEGRGGGGRRRQRVSFPVSIITEVPLFASWDVNDDVSGIMSGKSLVLSTFLCTCT